MAGKHSEGEKGGQKDSIGKSPLKCHLWDLVKEVFKDEGKRCLMLNEDAHLLEKEDDNIDKDQSAQGQAKDLQILTNNISLEGPMAFRHLQKTLSI
jgi:hypothetical protein